MFPRLRLLRCASRRRYADRSGFTLLEVLVAFTVMATLLSVLFRGVVTMRSGAAAFEDRTAQQTMVRAVFEDALDDRSLASGRYTGKRNGFRWTILARPMDLSRQLPRPREDEAGAGTASSTQKKDPSTANTTGTKDDAKPKWVLQRLIVRMETKSKPVEIETIRLVKPERKD